MNRKALKLDAKAAMKQASANPYVATIIVGVITSVLFGMQSILDVWSQVITYEDPDALTHQLVPYMLVSIVMILILLIVGTIIQFGYMRFCLKIADRDSNVSFKDLFFSPKHVLKAIGLGIVITIFTTLWSLLFIIPGIIASYRYVMAPYIFIENPDKGIMQCIRESKEMMVGHKFEFFVLGLSFILWSLLGCVTCGLAMIYISPYMYVTFANFYNSLKPQNTISEEAVVVE